LRSVINTHHLPHEFTEELLAEVRATAQSFDPQAESVHRETLAGQPVITIDPESARDYDDAISLRRVLDEPNGTDWELGVHIADVSHFVPRDSLVDEEAFERGTSVYFPGHVIPMLPELLSNGLCSLQEGEQRLCKSVFIRYDRHGRVVARRYASTVICSDCRLSYQQATAIIEDQAVDVPDRVYKLVRDMADLARIIRERRLADGMIVLDLPAVDLVLDKQGEVVDAQPEDTSFSHTVIEMFMVEANEAVADLFDRFKVPYLRRIHPPPGAEDRESMRQYFRALGIPVRGKIKPRDIQQGLAEVEDKPGAFAANLFVLKSLQTAEYSPRKTGHFALASQAYAHFTSPIRRYPDLMIHRLLERLLPQLPAWIPAASGKPTHRDADAPVRDMPSGRQLEEIGQTLSCKARRAEAAEQELKTLKVLRLLQRHVGETFTGVATGITQFGIFVQHPRYLVDGLVRLERLGDDWWEVKADKGQVVGVRSGRVWSLGSEMEVVIDQVDLPARQMALSMAGKQRGSRRKQSGKPKKHSRKAGRGRASGKPNRSRRKR
jgi:ribonuclease R